MNRLKRRASYQYGSLILEKRKRGASVWLYRFFEIVGGKKTRRKVILGTEELLPTRAEAERACEHLRLSANSTAPIQSQLTMQGLIDRYVEEVLRPCLDVLVGGEQDEGAQLSFHCAKCYKSLLDRYVRPRWETCEVQHFERPATRAAIEQWLQSMWRSTRNPNGLAPKTVRAIFNAMRLVFKFGVKWGYLDHNPMGEKRVELPRGSTKRLKRSAQITPADFFQLLFREKLAVAFAGWLGPRISEAFGLRWQDLDLEEGVVTFRRGFVQGRITPLKTEASRTNLPLPKELLELLRSWRCVTPYNRPGDWLFASPYTKGQRPFWPGQLFKSYIKPVALKAGLPNMGWHSFRHTVSAWGKEAGLGLEEVKTLLRHENITTTSELYGALEMGAKRKIQQ